jgi:NADH:ubiquinone oxidoreductase subunit C
MELKNKITNDKYIFTIIPNILFRSIFHHNNNLFFWNNKILFLLFIFQHHINFQQKCFVDLLSVDFIERRYRFTSIYNFLSVVYNQRIVLNTLIDESMMIHSITSLYPNAMWYERESWDLFGILYINNNDLRRILNDYGFRGFPLRKDFPLSGFLEVKYDYLKKSISYEPIRLIQEFRYFDTKVPWNFYH